MTFAGFQNPFANLMSEQNPNQPQGQPISLQAISQEFMLGLQRHFDVLAYNIAAHDSVSTATYDTVSASTRIMPFAHAHANHEQVQAFMQDLMVRNALNDAMGISAACMDNCYLLCQLIKNQGLGQTNAAEATKLVNEARQAFARMPFDQRFECFEKEFGIICELEDALISFGFALQALVQNNGVLTKEICDDSDHLDLEFKMLQVSPSAKDASKPEARLVTATKTYKVGDRIDLSKQELLSIPVTLAALFQNIFVGVDKYAKATLPAAPKTEA